MNGKEITMERRDTKCIEGKEENKVERQFRRRERERKQEKQKGYKGMRNESGWREKKGVKIKGKKGENRTQGRDLQEERKTKE